MVTAGVFLLTVTVGAFIAGHELGRNEEQNKQLRKENDQIERLLKETDKALEKEEKINKTSMTFKRLFGFED